MTYGAVYGIPIGARFRNRRSLYDAKVHCDIRRSIRGGPDKKRGAEICQYRLRSLQSAGETGSDDIKQAEAKRTLTTHYRLVRDVGVPARVKKLYDYRCQVCDLRIDTLAGPYSEGAHLVPLGGGADGPDVDANVLSLCPNHHIMLDHGAICFADDWTILDRQGKQLGSLNVHPDHRISVAYARIHRQLMGFDETFVSLASPR